jgi:hypothetical protein
MILMEEHDHEQCAHISQKKDHLTTSRVISDKTILQQFHTPYPKDRWMKDVENESK